MGNVAQNTFDAGQFMATVAKNAAEKLGESTSTTKIVSIGLNGKLLVFNVVVDVTLNNEPVPQAVISQVGAAAIGGIGLIALSAAGAPIAAIAVGGALAAYAGDKLIDYIYDWSSNHNLLDEIEQIGSNFLTTCNNVWNAIESAQEYTNEKFDEFGQALQDRASQLIEQAVEVGNVTWEKTWQEVNHAIDLIKDAKTAAEELWNSTAETIEEAAVLLTPIRKSSGMR